MCVRRAARLLAAIKLASSMNCRYQKLSHSTVAAVRGKRQRGKSSKCVVATRFSSRVCKQRNPGRLPHSWCRAPLYGRSWRARDVIVLIIICTCSAAQVNCTLFTSNAADECECRESREKERESHLFESFRMKVERKKLLRTALPVF